MAADEDDIRASLREIHELLLEHVELSRVMSCLLHALGRQPGINAPQLRDDFLASAELFWDVDVVPASVVNLMKQLEAGGIKKKRGVS